LTPDGATGDDDASPQPSFEEIALRARHRRVRSRAQLLTAVTAVVVLAAGCGGGSGGKSTALGQPEPGATATGAAPAATNGIGAQGASSAPKAKASRPGSTSAPASAQRPSAASTAAGSSHSGASAAASAAPQQASTVKKVDVKCRKSASSVGSGVAVKGQRPPTFTGTTLDCGSLDMADYTNGKPTLVTFFAAWCEPCHKEAKDLEAVYEEYHSSKGFQVVGVDTQDESGNPKWFYEQAHWTFPSVWDDGEKIEKAWNSTGVISTLPASFWIHPDGTISSTIIGEMSRSQMEDEFNKL
jgi:peroxiredoxin